MNGSDDVQPSHIAANRQRQEKNRGVPGGKGEAESFTSHLPAYITRLGREKMTPGTLLAENVVDFSETV